MSFDNMGKPFRNAHYTKHCTSRRRPTISALSPSFLSQSYCGKTVMAEVSKHDWLQGHRKLKNTELNVAKYVGLWMLDPKSPMVLRHLYFTYNKFVFTLLYIFAITLFADMCSSFDDLSITTDDGCVFAGISVVILKAMNFHFRRERIARLSEDILSCGQELCDFSTQDMGGLINVYFLRDTASFYGFSMLGFSLVIALMFLSPTENGELPINARYPFDTKVSPWHEIGFMIQMCSVSGGMAAIIAIEGTTIMLCNLLTLQFNILNENFRNFRKNMPEVITYGNGYNCKEESNKIDDSFMDRYKKYLQFHQRLVFAITEYNKIFSSSMFVQILSSTSMICLTGFQAVVVGGQSSNIFKFGIYLSAAISQLLYICWTGNELAYSSSMITENQWLSDWHHISYPRVGRSLMLFSMFSRQSIKVNAGKFYALSLQTFIAIMRRSYSFFTLLNNMHSANNR